MGIEPLYLEDGGKIIFVEGESDEIIIKDWIKRQFPGANLPLIKDTGGCGKIKQEFLKPLLSSYKDNIFLIYDSDGSSEKNPKSKEIEALEKWLNEVGIKNYYILQSRELENYVGHEALAKALNIHPSKIKPLEDTDQWHDMKKSISTALGSSAIYSEKRHLPAAYETLSDNEKLNLFKNENHILKGHLAKFLGTSQAK